MAIRSALNQALDHSITNIKLYSDAQDLIRAINSQEQVKEIYGLLFDIFTLVSMFTSILFHFVPRSKNLLADSLAKIAKENLVASMPGMAPPCSWVAAPASVENYHFWKRACTTIAGPALASVEASVASVKADLFATSDGSSDSAKKEKAKEAAKTQRKKRKMFEELLENRRVTRVKKTLNALRRREKEYGVSITQADLVRWARRLDKNGKHQHAYEMFEWMEEKKMTFSPSELATFVGLIEKTKDLGEAFAYFKKADPDFDNMDLKCKNWPAYQVLLECYFARDDHAGFT
ncbi:unnamed protein product [Microthlaspi erraticum]|uniref:RNase H type-1 domain-containing protein n=1 Tax=Microthlaspi erraticum TaxID=1685480 RepID=A0A6D2I5U9_9BRAS|nr:unnamed protein product [Microthlaspi erraticum]